jgi:hypothetical protein
VDGIIAQEIAQIVDSWCEMKHDPSMHYAHAADPRTLGGLFAAPPALDDPPRQTANQRTRWATSDAAYALAAPGVAGRILDSLRASPATCDEIETRLNLTHQTASASINGLMRHGAIVASGARLTRSGRAARVWVAVANG